MVNDITLFKFQDQPVRTILVNDEPYFVAKDVAAILGYARLRKAVNDHVDPEDKKELIVNISQSSQNGTHPELTLLITESGLYSLILSSKLPKAKKFKHWVTSEVLPAIRKQGAYITKPKARELLTDPNSWIDMLRRSADLIQQQDI